MAHFFMLFTGANKPTENVLNYLVQCINETTVSVSWGPIDEEQNINLINLEYTCYDRDNNTQVMSLCNFHSK